MKMANYNRSNSLCSNPTEQIKQAVEENNTKRIETLVKSNKELLKFEYESGRTILDYACYDFANYVHAETIEKLLNLGADPYHTNKNDGYKTSLHYAALGQNPHILRTLITSLPEDKRNLAANENTALHTLIKDGDTKQEGFMECIRILVENGVNPRLLDKKNHTALWFAARKSYKNVVTYLLGLDTQVTQDEAEQLKKLAVDVLYSVIKPETLDQPAFYYLRRREQKEFIEKLQFTTQKNDEEREQSYLQYACENHLDTAIDSLCKIDPNKVGSTGSHPIAIAVRNGYHKIVERLLRAPGIQVPSNILNDILINIDNVPTTNSDYKRTYQLLLNYANVDVNAQDDFGNYPLHYAAKYGGTQIVADLLDKHASLANRNRMNEMPVKDIHYESLKEHFDNCIQAHPVNRLEKAAMCFTLDYSTLLPKYEHQIETSNLDCEAEPAAPIHKNNTLFGRECDVIMEIAKEPELKPLLKHPLIVVLLNAKWHRVRGLFYMNLFLYVLFCVTLLTFILKNYHKESNFGAAGALLLVFTILITIREVFQMVLMTKKYIRNIDNYIEVGLIIDVFFMMFWTMEDIHVRRQMYAVAILFASLELLFLVGSIPGLSTYIIMLRTVSFNFCKFLLFNSILIIAFAFSFFTLFNPTPGDEVPTETPPTKDKDEEEDKQWFTNIYISMFKTLLMLTGEFEAGDLKFDQFPITSHLIFLLFVVLIAIILLNLLNGLAVSDTQEIKNEAKLIALTSRAQYINYIESLAFGGKSLPSRLKEATCECCSRNSPGRFSLISKKIRQRVSIRGFFLNRNDVMKVYPNENGRIEVQDQQKVSKRYSNACVDEGTLKQIRYMISKKNQRENNELRMMIQKLQEEMQDVKNLLLRQP